MAEKNRSPEEGRRRVEESIPSKEGVAETMESFERPGLSGGADLGEGEAQVSEPVLPPVEGGAASPGSEEALTMERRLASASGSSELVHKLSKGKDPADVEAALAALHDRPEGNQNS